MMGPAAADATPLIHLSKLDLLDVLDQFYEAILVPDTVYEEVVVGGRAGNFPDALRLERAFEDGLLALEEDPSTPEDVPESLGLGESKAIALAVHNEADLLVDDSDAWALASAMGVRPRRTTSLLLEGVAEGYWDVDHFRRLLRRLTATGYFLTADVFLELVERAERMQEQA